MQPARLTAADSHELAATRRSEYVTVMLGKQLIGIPVLSVQDVLGEQKIARIPLAPPEVAGTLNLRGRIVTAINLRTRLGLPEADLTGAVNVVVHYRDELYSLLVDQVCEVMSISADQYEKNPANLQRKFKEVSSGVYRLKGALMIVLDVEKVLAFTGSET